MDDKLTLETVRYLFVKEFEEVGELGEEFGIR